MAKLSKKEFIESLKEMNIKEVMELVDAMKEEWGIDPSAIAVAANNSGNGSEEDSAPSEVTVTLKAVGVNKVSVIKVVKEITGVGLMDAKKIVDSVPSAIKESIKPEEAEEIKDKLVAVGAEVEIS